MALDRFSVTVQLTEIQCLYSRNPNTSITRPSPMNASFISFLITYPTPNPIAPPPTRGNAEEINWSVTTTTNVMLHLSLSQQQVKDFLGSLMLSTLNGAPGPASLLYTSGRLSEILYSHESLLS